MSDLALKKGTVVFSQGDPGDCMYYIRWGKVGLYTGYKTLGQKKVAELVQGDYFGEMSLIDGEKRTVTAVVMEKDTSLEAVSQDTFARFLRDNPSKVYQIIEQLSHQLRETTKSYLAICQSVSNSVGAGADKVDESSDYRFGQNEHLRKIHESQASTPATNA